MLPALLTDTVTSNLDRAVHYTLLWGLEGVELRTVGHAGDRVPFVNEEKLRRRLAEHDLPVVAIVPGLFEGAVADRSQWMNELAMFGETLRFCQRIGCRRIVVSSFAAASATEGWVDLVAESLHKAGTAAADAGVSLAVLNEVGMHCATGRALAMLLDAVGHTAVQAAWHPWAALQAGEDPVEGLAALEGRLALVRCADGRKTPQGWTPTPLGEGAVDWPAHLLALRRAGFEGPLSLEVQVAPKPRQGLRDATSLMRHLQASDRRS